MIQKEQTDNLDILVVSDEKNSWGKLRFGAYLESEGQEYLFAKVGDNGSNEIEKNEHL